MPRAVDLLQNGALKTYDGYPHGMLTTHADVLNPDLLAFIAFLGTEVKPLLLPVP